MVFCYPLMTIDSKEFLVRTHPRLSWRRRRRNYRPDTSFNLCSARCRAQLVRWVPATRFELVRACAPRRVRPLRLPIPPRRPPLVRCRRPWHYDTGPNRSLSNRAHNMSRAAGETGIVSLCGWIDSLRGPTGIGLEVPCSRLPPRLRIFGPCLTSSTGFAAPSRIAIP